MLAAAVRTVHHVLDPAAHGMEAPKSSDGSRILSSPKIFFHEKSQKSKKKCSKSLKNIKNDVFGFLEILEILKISDFFLNFFEISVSFTTFRDSDEVSRFIWRV